MGILLSRFRKSKTTVEILEDIDKQIVNLEKYRVSNEALRAKVVFKVIFYSISSYFLILVGFYFYPVPDDIIFQVLQWMLIIMFPFLIYLMKKTCHWWFIRKTRQNEHQLKEFRDQRKEILENVMETETYKKAKEILEKFDPETKRKLEEERKKAEIAANAPPPATPGTELRRRNNANGDNSPPVKLMSTQQRMRFPPNTPLPPQGPLRQAPPPLPRPILRQNRSTVDKMMEFLVGDGPNNRYALICANCYAHNGMALREEFEYIDFICAYCRFFNKARKQKPGAPSLDLFASPAVTRHVPSIMTSQSSVEDTIPSTLTSNTCDDVKQQQQHEEVGGGDDVNKDDVSNTMTSSLDGGDDVTTATSGDQQSTTTTEVVESPEVKEETNADDDTSETEEEKKEETVESSDDVVATTT